MTPRELEVPRLVAEDKPNKLLVPFFAFDAVHFVPQSERMKTLCPEGSDCWQLRPLARDGALMPVAHRWLSAVMLVALGLVLAGGASVTQGAEFQQGSYSGTRLRGDEVTLRFDHKGKFLLTDKEGKVLVEGTYKATKDQIEFTDENGPMAAKGAKPGEYKWKLEDKALNFTKVEDDSEGRSKGLTGTRWTSEK